MKVTLAEVSYVSDLASLELTEAERANMVTDLSSILGFIERLNELDTTGVQPMAQVVAGTSADSGSQRFAYARRPDEAGVRPSLDHEAALQNAPVRGPGFFKVPKVIER